MTTHRLKSWPEFFVPVVERRKTWEIRVNDRRFEEGDVLFLVEWDPISHDYTGRNVYARVRFVAPLDRIGFPNVVGMSIEVIA